jgi:hypothetical protein
MVRSTLVLTEDRLNSIGTADGQSWFPDRQAVWNNVRGKLPDWLLLHLPTLGSSETSEIAKIYNESAYHLLTHDKRAEAIWSTTADVIADLEMPFARVPSMAEPLNGNDGGVDDLRRTGYGYLATQVKGGKTLTGFTAPSPRSEAQNFFSVDGQQARPRKRKQRLKLYPFLAEQVKPGVTQDDLLHLHYLALGKRISGDGATIRGRSGAFDRAMYVTGLDVIILKPSEHYSDRQRVDASASSKRVIKTFEVDQLIEPEKLDTA